MTRKMGHWKTDEIVAAIEKMLLVESVKTKPPGGDYDTTNLFITIEDGDASLYVAGYPSVQDCLERHEWDDRENCEFVSITDGQDSRGGLNSRDDNVISVFYSLDKYFRKNHFCVIRHYNEIF